MNFKNLCITNGIVCLLFGLPLLLFPNAITDLYMVDGESLTKSGEVLSRLYGTILVGLGIALFVSIKAQESYGRRGLLTLITIANILAAITHTYSILQGLENSSAWSTVVLVVIFAVWGGMLLSKEKKLSV